MIPFDIIGNMKKPIDDPILIDLSQERKKRIHDIHEKNLQEINDAFEKAFPLAKKRKIKKQKKKK